MVTGFTNNCVGVGKTSKHHHRYSYDSRYPRRPFSKVLFSMVASHLFFLLKILQFNIQFSDLTLHQINLYIIELSIHGSEIVCRYLHSTLQ
jgi:hypothetical protein